MNGLKELMLRAPKLTLAAAESITCGRVQAKIGATAGASGFFLGGITAYTIGEKVRHLGVDREAADNDKAVSARIAEQMARGACALFGADLGVATTGYAESPSGLEPRGKRPGSQPFHLDPPYSWWAVAWVRPDGSSEVRSGRIECPGASRAEAQEQVAEAALAALLDWLRAERK